MVLLDDNFATIVAAVARGPADLRQHPQVRHASCSRATSARSWTLLLAPFFGLPIPLLPIQILWMNLVTDGLPGLALAVEPEERAMMRRPPRPPGENLFARGSWQHIVWVGLLIGGSVDRHPGWGMADGAHWQTMVFTVLDVLRRSTTCMAVRSEASRCLRWE